MKLMKYSRDENFVRFRFGDELTKLADMGFLNEELNLHLIQKNFIRCTVNLQAVIEELQAYQTSSGSCSVITVESPETPAEE